MGSEDSARWPDPAASARAWRRPAPAALLGLLIGAGLLLGCAAQISSTQEATMANDLWELARKRQGDQVFSTLFTAQSVERQLKAEAGIDEAIAWCRQTGVTKVYVESFRDGLLAQESNLVRARDRFRQAGLEVSGCVTTTRMAKSSEVGWEMFPCFTHPPTQQQLEEIFRYTARLFDEIMIDDFYCTACECADCQAGRGSRSWAEYRLPLMQKMSGERVLGPARAVNPKVRIIIKYPQWYEEFHERGYDVEVETRLFDRIWVGTESRDMDSRRWGGCATYRPFWIMRWLGQIGAEKCGGGWYDPYGTHEDTYLEQARQTVLGGARESLLFCYPSLLEHTGAANVAALRQELPKLFELAAWVKHETPRGIVSYRPMNAPAGEEQYIFDWLGMVGLPVIPAHEFPADEKVACFAFHAKHDRQFRSKSEAFLGRGGTAIYTESAAAAAGVSETTKGGYIFGPPRETRGIMQLPPSAIAALRRAALQPLGLSLEGPVGVALYLFGDRKVALESFNNQLAEMRLGIRHAGRYRIALTLGREGAGARGEGEALIISIPPRTLVALERPAG